MKKNTRDYWQHWKRPIGWTTSNLLILGLGATKLGSHFIGEVPAPVQTSIETVIALVCVNLLFSLHNKAASQETAHTYTDFDALKPELEKLIMELGATGKVVKIRFIGIAMYQSYEWITDKMQHLVASNPQLKLEFEICMNSREELEKWKFDTSGINWPKLAQENLEGLIDCQGNKQWTCGGRIQIKAVYVYENLPQWHGLLINDHHLYLGQSTFEEESLDDPNRKTRFTTGQNMYYGYGTHDCYGRERISEFERWFKGCKRIAKESHFSKEPPSWPSAGIQGANPLILNPAT